jgi:UDP-N-acetylmuramate--alanine ligase
VEPSITGLLDLSTPRSVHVIGAGGAGMNAIAAVLLASGHRVSGSDMKDSVGLDRLRAMGARIDVGHDAANLDPHEEDSREDRPFVAAVEVVARSTAVPDSNVEVIEARRRGIPVLSRASILSAISSQQRTVAVAGTHGKTTTSSMLSLVLVGTGLHPSFIVGGDVNEIGSGAVWDDEGEWFVVEADESDGTFLALGAEAVVVTNIEADHLDFYGSFDAIEAAFRRFAGEAQGPRVICADDDGARNLVTWLGANGDSALTYGRADDATYRIDGYQPGRSSSDFSIVTADLVQPIHLCVPGLHNALNATAAFAMAVELGADPDGAADALGRFAGVARRFEFRGELNGATLVDDYAHLPTEVAAAINAARSGGWDRVVAVFQPHRYSRTADLWREFADAFVEADKVILTSIYSSGEAPRPGITGELLVHAVLDSHPNTSVAYLPRRSELQDYLLDVVRPGDLCLTMGAGDITSLHDELIDAAGPNAG